MMRLGSGLLWQWCCWAQGAARGHALPGQGLRGQADGSQPDVQTKPWLSAHPQPLPPGPPPGSPLPPRLACDLTWEPPSLDPSRCLGLGFPAWRRGCSRPGHMLLLKWGSRWGRLLPHRAGGPGDLGELLFRSRMVKDSPRASCLWDPHPLHSPFCLQGGQCRPWAVPPLPQPPPGLQGRGWVVTGYLAPGPRPGRPAGGAVQRGSAEVRSFLAPQERGCR